MFKFLTCALSTSVGSCVDGWVHIQIHGLLKIAIALFSLSCLPYLLW
jgi:hypothetical protein